ncbi:MAG: hypothetical protein NTW25_06750 [Candidatus Kapabacteria bacterium]|nr:hypothetical protein [Candidatus Kapabacteria bacterium]
MKTIYKYLFLYLIILIYFVSSSNYKLLSYYKISQNIDLELVEIIDPKINGILYADSNYDVRVKLVNHSDLILNDIKISFIITNCKSLAEVYHVIDKISSIGIGNDSTLIFKFISHINLLFKDMEYYLTDIPPF